MTPLSDDVIVGRRRARTSQRTAPFTCLISGTADAVTDGIGHVSEQICVQKYCDDDLRSSAVNQRHRTDHLPATCGAPSDHQTGFWGRLATERTGKRKRKGSAEIRHVGALWA